MRMESSGSVRRPRMVALPGAVLNQGLTGPTPGTRCFVCIETDLTRRPLIVPTLSPVSCRFRWRPELA